MATQYRNTIGPTVQYTNVFNSFNKGSGYGAAFGSKFGPWGALIGAAVGGTVGVLQAKFANKEATKMAKAQLEAAKTANNATLEENARQMGELWRQQAIMFTEASTSLAYAKSQANVAKAEQINAIQSADQVGNLAAYVRSEIDRDLGITDYMTRFNLETQIMNQNAQLVTMFNQAEGAFVGVNIEGGSFSISEALSDAMAAAGSMDFGKMSGGSSGSSGTGNAGATAPKTGGSSFSFTVDTPKADTGKYTTPGGTVIDLNSMPSTRKYNTFTNSEYLGIK